jgi:chlorite dismutase
MTSTSTTPAAPTATYTAFWLLRRAARERLPIGSREAMAEYQDLFQAHRHLVALRGAYRTAGLCAGVDLILWLVVPDLGPLQDLALGLGRTALGRMLEPVQVYLGVAGASQYDPRHGPAFLRGLPPKRYLSVYPFTKTPAWYLLPFEERRALMAEHGKLGEEFSTILTNTVSSFGIADQEFVVALEDDDPATLVKMVQRLRAARVREYTQLDTPIVLGRCAELPEALADLV